MAKKLTSTQNARTTEQRKVMEAIEEAAECPFCQKNISKYHKKPIIKKGKYWVLTESQWPYKHTTHHYLAIAKKHAEKLSDLPKAAYAELFEFFQQLEQKHKLTHGGIGMRFGETSHTGATVLHLHAHLIVADVDAPDYETVRFKIG